MKKDTVIELLRALKVIPVIQIEKASDALPLAKVLIENGLPAVEITLRTDAALDAIFAIAQTYPQMMLCAGTVLNKEQVNLAIKAGADFVISPGFNPTTVNYCIDNNITIIPGVNNPSAVEQAIELGLTVLKFFPAEASGGINMLKSLTGPYSQIQWMPTGGVGVNNVRDYLAIQQVLACGGTWIAPVDLITSKQWDKIANNIQTLLAHIQS